MDAILLSDSDNLINTQEQVVQVLNFTYQPCGNIADLEPIQFITVT